MVHRSYTHKNTNKPEIQTDTIKHRQTEVNTDSHTKNKNRQNKERNYYKTEPRTHRCLTKTLLLLYIHLLNTTLQLLKSC